MLSLSAVPVLLSVLLSRLRALRVVDLSFNHLSADVLRIRLPDVAFLHLQYNRFQDARLEALELRPASLLDISGIVIFVRFEAGTEDMTLMTREQQEHDDDERLFFLFVQSYSDDDGPVLCLVQVVLRTNSCLSHKE